MQNQIEDLTGQQFGKWEVLKRDTEKHKTNDIRWICRCECGNVKSVLGKYLRTGKSQSCGCGRYVDLSGKRYGNILVLETLHKYQGNKRAVHKCQCDCGKIFYIHSPVIMQKSCGCYIYQKNNIVGQKFGQLLVEKMLYNYKNNSKTYCECLCDCGNRVIVSRNGLTTGNTTSCGCKHSPSLLNKKYGRLLVLDEVINQSSQRTWKCRCDCGNELIVTSYQLTSGHTKSCGCLRSENVSYNEVLIAKTLKSLQINFEKEKTFYDCKGVGNKCLRFDFYIPQLNLCIEYDGEQHFKPVEFFGGQSQFETLKQNDEIKNNYCKLHNIHLLRIPYYFKEEQILTTLKSIIQNPVTTTVA